MILLGAIDWYAFFFLLFALVTCCFAVGVVLASNIVRMAFYLTLSLGAAAGSQAWGLLGPGTLPAAAMVFSACSMGRFWLARRAELGALRRHASLDLAFVGMPGCQLRTDLGVVAGPWVAAGSSFSYSLALPAAPPALLGQQLFTQAATLSNPPVNAFGAITSNGIRGTLGDI